jgi:hypothetical protein
MSDKTSSPDEINNRPVIGILTNALSNWLGDNITIDSKKAKSYLPAAYVNWIENSGARVVPIQYTATKPIILSYLTQLNGVIICGDISPLNYATLKKGTQFNTNILRWAHSEFIIFQWAKKQNNLGKYFPVLGIGMGYEELIFMNLMPEYYSEFTNSKSVWADLPAGYKPTDELVKASDTYRATPLTLTDTPGIFGSKISKADRKLWATNPVCYTTPGWTMNAKSKKIDKLKEFLEINSIVKEQKSKAEYINIYSFKEYPFYGMAFHPEAVIYSWIEKEIPQTDVGVEFSLKMSEIFVNECRKNLTQLTSNKILIYNYTLFSSEKVLKILYPEKWQTMQLKKHFTNSYFFGLTYHTHKTAKKNKKGKPISQE